MSPRSLSLAVRAFGALLLLAGITAVALGVLEFEAFYLFGPGGKFEYEGFAFGSFMFANIACQVAAYYAIGLLLIPLGYGHLALRRWVPRVILALTGCWMVLGLPLIVAAFFMLVTAKPLSLAGVFVAGALLTLSYFALPFAAAAFYRGNRVAAVFAAKETAPTRLEALPIPLLTLAALYGFYLLLLHVPLLFNGLFPAFGHWVTGRPGILSIDGAILLLGLLFWGTLARRRLAWWGALAYFGLLATTSIWTLLRSSYQQLLDQAHFAPLEMEALHNVPAQGWHLAVLFGLPLLLTVGLILATRRQWQPVR